MKEIILDDADRLLPVSEVAVRLNISKDNVAKLLNNGVLPFIRCGTAGRSGGPRRYIRKATFNKFLEKLEGQDLKDLLVSAE